MKKLDIYLYSHTNIHISSPSEVFITKSPKISLIKENVLHQFHQQLRASTSLIKDNRRNLKALLKKGNGLISIHKVPIKIILSLKIMQVKLLLLASMVMVPSRICFPKPKNANPITNPQSQHHSLHPRRVVVEKTTFMSLTPLLQTLPHTTTLLHEPLHGIVLGDPRTQHVEPRISYQQWSLVRSIAHSVVH